MTTTTSRSQRICVLKCSENKHLHAFPKDEISRNVWLKQLGIKRANTTSYVCDRHFSSKMKPPGVGVKLTPWAIPDINLPDRAEQSDSEEEYLQEETIDISEEHTNGYSVEEDTTKDEVRDRRSVDLLQSAENNDELDFDVLLAKVHCISDLTKNNNQTTASINCEESEDIDDYDDSNEQYFSPNQSSSHVIVENGDVVNEDTFSAPFLPVEINSNFKRKLIASVKKRRILYDPAHPSFSNVEKKNRTWERIGKILKLDGSSCRELWLNMRYDYQVHVRSLRQWLAGESNLRERPRIEMENELLFLWRFIADKSYCEDSDDDALHMSAHQTSGMSTSSDPLITSNDYACSVDHAYANNQGDESTNFACSLIEAIKPYSELYDPMHPNHGDPKRKSIIWDAISNELKEKATKCLYTWIQIQLRYEFEIIHKKFSYLVNKLDFLKKHILPNERSHFKRITSLLDQWHEPMTVPRDQHILIQSLVATKRYRPFFLNIDSPPAMCKDLPAPCWLVVGRNIQRIPEQCEVTWVVLQAMYTEVSQMRRNNCPLRDEWEFESVITNFRATILRSNKKLSRDFPAIAEDGLINDTEAPSEPPAPPPPPPPPSNEITFTIPAHSNEGNPPMQQIVRFKLNTAIKDLPERSIVEIDSVLENAHIVIMTHIKKPPAIYLFTLQRRKELIAEVMARPLLFNDPCKNSRLARIFWGEISVVTGHPAEICMFFWDYIVEKLYFLDYDPSYKKSKGSKWIPPPNPIFDKFQKYADSKDWGEYISVLPEFIQEISNFPLIYIDLKINSSWNRRQCHVRDISEVWSLLGRKFSVLENPKVIWDKFKQLFLLYMSEMEISIYNAWPKFWFPVLEKMTFLTDLRYKPKDPIYHVIKYKINEEITEYHRENPAPPKLDSVTNAKAIFRILKENEYLNDFTWLNRARFLARLKMFPVLYNVSHPQFGNREAKLEAWQEMALTFHCTVGECHLIFQHLMKSFLLFRARDPNQVCRVNAKYWENMTYIYSCAVPNVIDSKLLEGRTFRSASTGSTIKLAEEFQAEISLVDAKARLVLKNFGAAVNSLPVQIQSSVVQRIKYICNEYSRIQNEEIVVDV